jgi:hypothetical protein
MASSLFQQCFKLCGATEFTESTFDKNGYLFDGFQEGHGLAGARRSKNDIRDPDDPVGEDALHL